MSLLKVTYADGSVETVGSDLTPEQFFDSRFGGYSDEVKAKVKVEQADETPAPEQKPKSKK